MSVDGAFIKRSVLNVQTKRLINAPLTDIFNQSINQSFYYRQHGPYMRFKSISCITLCLRLNPLQKHFKHLNEVSEYCALKTSQCAQYCIYAHELRFEQHSLHCHKTIKPAQQHLCTNKRVSHFTVNVIVIKHTAIIVISFKSGSKAQTDIT